MKTFTKQAAQGDMLITKIDVLPEGLNPMKSENNTYVCAHSETGHNHIIKSQGVQAYEAVNDPFVMYLVVDNKSKMEHLRSFDTHEAISLLPGTYRINRQREYSPEGFRKGFRKAQD